MKKNRNFWDKMIFRAFLSIGVLAFLSFSCTSTLPGERTARAQQDGMDMAFSLQNSFRAVSSKVLPVVVELRVVDISTQRTPQFNDWREFFFGNPEGGEEREFRNQGLGSGVLIERDGRKVYVLTNNHVVEGAEEIEVVLNDGRSYEASLVGTDPRKDLAIVLFETREQDIELAVLGDSDSLFIGDWVLAVGSPLGFTQSVTAGIVSAKGRRGPQGNINDFIQTDAAINRGNSGGALVNLNGEVVGINTWIATSTGTNIGLGFAIPINNAKRTIEDLISSGGAQYGWLGVSGYDIPEIIADNAGLENEKGGFIVSVFRESPAFKAGLRSGDLVLEINGAKINSYLELTRIVGDLRVGDKADFVVNRFGEVLEFTVTIGNRESEEQIERLYAKLWPGLEVLPLTEEIKDRAELDKSLQGVIISHVFDGTLVKNAGLQINDIVTKINDTPVESLQDFYTALAGSEGRFLFTVLRGENEIEIGVRL
jgi:serine protease Do